MILREMLVDDLDQVMEIETDLFHVPWTKEGFFTFLTREDAMFLVVEEKGEDPWILRSAHGIGRRGYHQCGSTKRQAERRNRQFPDGKPDRLAVPAGSDYPSIWKSGLETLQPSVCMNGWDLPGMESVKDITVTLWRMLFL